MTPMLEKIARAIDPWAFRPMSVHVSVEARTKAKEKAVEAAINALLALRDIDNDILPYGFEAMFEQEFRDEYPMMSVGWEAMIDAILAQPSTPTDVTPA